MSENLKTIKEIADEIGVSKQQVPLLADLIHVQYIQQKHRNFSYLSWDNHLQVHLYSLTRWYTSFQLHYTNVRSLCKLIDNGFIYENE
mgnify:CR=1 FL=1